MVDRPPPSRPPPSRYAVIERGGRLVVIDKESGLTPPTAAERMEAYDRARGVEAIRPAPKAASSPLPEPPSLLAPVADAKRRPSPPPAVQAAATPGRVEPAPITTKPSRQPWSNPGRPAPSARAAQTGPRQTIVTGQWWDAKGPRSVELGTLGQARLRGGFMALAGGIVLIAVILMVIAPVMLLAFGFILFRFGRNILGPIGASLIDKALAEPS